jgi:hypothetical protein
VVEHPCARRRIEARLGEIDQSLRTYYVLALAATTDDVFSELTLEERRALHRLVLRALGQPTEIADELQTSGPP